MAWSWGQRLEPMVRQLRSPRREVRLRALEPLSRVVYEKTTAARRLEVCSALTAWLRSEKDASTRSKVAALLQSWLSAEETPTRAFVLAEPLLTDPNAEVRSMIWMGFRQPASQPHLTPDLRERLLALLRHPDAKVRLEAVNWMNEAAANDQRGLDQPESAFSRRVFALQLDGTHSDDPEIRNLSTYGVLQLLRFHQAEGVDVIRRGVRDPHAATRSLVLDFLEQQGGNYDQLASLQPDLLVRFREQPASPDFPLVPDPEMGPDARSAASERLRVAMAMNSLGELPAEVWPFLSGVQAEPYSLIGFPYRQGPAGRALLTQLLAKVPAAQWWEWAGALVETGAGAEVAPQLAAMLEPFMDREPAEGDPARFRLGEVLLSLATGEQPQAVPLALRLLQHPQPQVRYAAIYALLRLDAAGPGGARAVEALASVKHDEDTFGTDCLVGAVWLLRGRPGVPRVTVDHFTDNLLLSTLQGLPTDGEAPFLDSFANGSPTNRYCNGPGREHLLAQLLWIGKHQARRAAPGVRALLHHPNPVLRSAAREMLAQLGR